MKLKTAFFGCFKNR